MGCVVNSCCCGCTLRTGSLIIGILSLIGGILNLIGSVIQTQHTHISSGWFSVVVYGLMAIVSIILLLGIRKENPRFVKMWVYMQGVVLVLITISSIIFLVQVFDVGVLVAALISIALNGYFMVVVHSFALQLESGGGANPA